MLGAVSLLSFGSAVAHGAAGDPWDSLVSAPFPLFTAEQLAWPLPADSVYDSDGMVVNGRREPSVAVNPKNPANLVAIYPDVIAGVVHGKRHGIQTCSRPFSEDHGLTWHAGQPEDYLGDRYDGNPHGQGNVGFCENVLATSSAKGIFYTVTMVGIEPVAGNPILQQAGALEGNVWLNRSTDGGRTWQRGPSVADIRVHAKPSDPSPVGEISGPNDLIADRNEKSPYVNGVYWVSQGSDQWEVSPGVRGGGAWLRYSADDGQTISKPIVIDTDPMIFDKDGAQEDGGIHGPKLAIGPRGELYVFYVLNRRDGNVKVAMKVSEDGGNTFSERRYVVGFWPFTVHGKVRDPRWGSGDVNIWQTVYNGLSVKGAVSPDGALWLVYTEVTDILSCSPKDRRACTNQDVRLVRSTDEGRTWSQPIRFTDETNATDQFRPEIQAHPNGTVSIAWIDKRDHPDNLAYDVYYTNTRNGKDFLPNVRLSSQSSPLTSSLKQAGGAEYAYYDMNFTGDWGDSDVWGPEFHYIWSDMRQGASLEKQIPKEIWQATVRLCGAEQDDQPQAICKIR